MIIDYDIVIVGLGPVGGTLANLLGLNGLSVLVLEREASLYNLPRAVHFDDEIMRVFNTIGIANKISKKLIINKGTKFLDEKEKLILDCVTGVFQGNVFGAVLFRSLTAPIAVRCPCQTQIYPLSYPLKLNSKAWARH